jgi:phosphatidylserine decarboxylase
LENNLSPFLQQFMPQQGLSRFAGFLANSHIPWLKNKLIRYFVNRHAVNMQEALESNPFQYLSFNAFFTRALHNHVRPIANGLSDFVSPADGTISQMGKITKGRLIQAKGHDFDVAALLGGEEALAKPFVEGDFLTIYLAPHDYHRVHMPIDGHLQKMIHVPGKLFSVNNRTTNATPNLFARNERVISIFNTSVGKVAVILVGAMIVGSIETRWAGTIAPAAKLGRTQQQWHYENPIYYKRGEEMGRFKLGSTVIVLLENNRIDWDSEFGSMQKVLFGQKMGILKHRP